MSKYPEKALTAAKIRKLSEPGMYTDGNCLYLVVEESGSKHWIVRTTIHGRRRDIGVGSLQYVSLADARDKAIEIRKAARSGADPLAEKWAQQAAAKQISSIPTFEAFTRETVFPEVSKGFTSAKHASNWIESLESFAFDSIGGKRIDLLTSADFLNVLSPIWLKVPERARRLKQRMRLICEHAKARHYRTGDNPLDQLKTVLPKQNREQEHFAALPYSRVAEFIRLLQSAESISGRLAFEFLILTASRTNEVILAKWSEIDFDNATWTRPAEHMKMRRAHKVPLTARCIDILKEAKRITDGGPYVFPGMREHRSLSNMVFNKTLDRMKESGVLEGWPHFTPHGFRSAFRDWTEEKTQYKDSVIEMAMAHINPNKVEAAYLRTQLFEERKPLMDAWARFCAATPGARVVRMSIQG